MFLSLFLPATSVRTVGMAFPYAVAVAIFGGTAPYLQNWISTQYSAGMFSLHVCLLLVVSTVVASILPETKAKDLAALGSAFSRYDVAPAPSRCGGDVVVQGRVPDVEPGRAGITSWGYAAASCWRTPRCRTGRAHGPHRSA